ncbi:MAG: class I SAM-dependent methyltransferase [Corynebacterium sp.]|nr:class I SAM-dependent methyltransferase [Corynebacterium sp.]
MDIGSGTGSVLPLLRDLGAEKLYAVEPSAAMRVGLVATLGRDRDLLARTTVIRTGVPGAFDRLPGQWDVVTMLNVIGHLDDGTRGRLWSELGNRLTEGGRFVVALQPPETAVEVPWTDFGAVRIGENEIRTGGAATPVDDQTVEWTMQWTLVNADGEEREKRTAVHRWRALSIADLEVEAREVGLTISGSAEGMPMVGFGRTG